MSFNLVDRVKSHIDDDLIALVSNAVNGSDLQTQTAVDGAIPGLLNNFLAITVNKLGAKSLFQSVNTQNDSILEHLESQLVESNHKSFANSGAYSLNLLLGSRKIKRLVDLLSGSSGLSHQSSSSLLGIVMPVILSVIKRDLQSSGKLNTRELVNLLQQQQVSILDALPANFIDRDDLDDIIQNSQKTQEGMSSAPLGAGMKRTRSRRKTRRKSSVLAKLLPFLLLPIIFYSLYLLFFRPTNEPMKLPEVQPSAQPNTHVFDVNKTVFTSTEQESLQKLKLVLDSVTTTLGQITDTKSAKDSLVELKQQTAELEKLSQHMQVLSADAKSEATALVNSTIPQMEVFYDQIKKIPGGQVIVEPVIDNLMTVLADMFI